VARAACLVDFEFLLVFGAGLQTLRRRRLLVARRPVRPEMAEMRAIRANMMLPLVRPVILVSSVRPSLESPLISSHEFSLVQILVN
jgi:hypothetical protein